jgi:hypothetical protein
MPVDGERVAKRLINHVLPAKGRCPAVRAGALATSDLDAAEAR